MDEKGNGAPQKIGFGLEIGVEDGKVIALLNVAVFQSFPGDGILRRQSRASWFSGDEVRDQGSH